MVGIVAFQGSGYHFRSLRKVLSGKEKKRAGKFCLI